MKQHFQHLILFFGVLYTVQLNHKIWPDKLHTKLQFDKLESHIESEIIILPSEKMQVNKV